MKKLIDSETFRNEKSLPIYYITLDRTLGGIQKDIVDKWIDENINGEWWYTDSKIFVFSSKDDLILFAMHYKSGMFSEENGNLDYVKKNWFDNFIPLEEPAEDSTET